MADLLCTVAGNIEADPRSSIHILDYKTGDSLQLSGYCTILWDETDLPGAQRTMHFVTEKWAFVRKAFPFETPGKVRWSPYNPPPSTIFSENIGKVKRFLPGPHCRFIAPHAML